MAKCAEKIWDGWGYRQCSRLGVIDGFCQQHHPDAVKKRAEESARRREEKRKQSPYHKLAEARKEIERLEKALAHTEQLWREEREKNK